MGKHRTIDERLEEANRLWDRYRKGVERHRKRSGQRASELAVRSEQLAIRWGKEVRRLQKQARVQEILSSRAPTPGATTPGSSATTPAPSKRDLKVIADRRKALATAGVEWDPRTATGGRAYEVVSMGAKSRALVSQFNACIRRRSERAPHRLLAWEEADRHFHWVHDGSLPSPKFEPGVDNKALPNIAESRLDAQRADVQFKAYIGATMHALLELLIFEHRTYQEVSERSGLAVELLEQMLPLALDLAAKYWRLGEDKNQGRMHKWTATVDA